MRRVNTLIYLLLLLLPVLLVNGMSTNACGQQRVVVLVSRDTTPYQQTLEALTAMLAAHGPGVSLDIHALQGEADEAMSLAQRVAKEGADLVLSLGELAANAMAQHRGTTPHVACMLLKPENITAISSTAGVSLEFPVEIQLDWLKRFVPRARTVGLLYDPGENSAYVQQAKTMAQKIGFTLNAQPVRSPQELPAALETLSRNVDVLWAIPDKTAVTPQTAKHLLLFSYRNRIPFVGLSLSWVKAGALYGLDRDYHDVGRQCGEIALQVLQGADVTDLPVQAPRRVVYAVNAKTAERMRLTIDPALLRDAVEVY